jgi:FkbM family methyltransferase
MNFIKKLIEAYRVASPPDKQFSFSQSGEDMIVNFVLTSLNISDIQYLDIGAHHPSYLSNTYHFYLKGHSGVCIEPNPELYGLFKKCRPRDTLLNIGIGVANIAEADYFVMSSSTLNTFSYEDAKRYQEIDSQQIVQTIKIPLIPVNEVIRRHFKTPPHFISLDVEGHDLEILQSFDFTQYRPEVFCVETLTYTENNTEEKINGIINFMLEQDYILYADTYINTIFVDRDSWQHRGNIVTGKE